MRHTVPAFLMAIDFSFRDGARSGLSFSFIPCDRDLFSQSGFDLSNTGVFSIREEAFLLVEGLIARSFPDWSATYRHWGTTWIGRATWLEIFARFDELRRDVTGNMPWRAIVTKYVLYVELMPRKNKLHRKALLTFLDRLEERVSSLIRLHSYVLISGI